MQSGEHLIKECKEVTRAVKKDRRVTNGQNKQAW